MKKITKAKWGTPKTIITVILILLVGMGIGFAWGQTKSKNKAATSADNAPKKIQIPKSDKPELAFYVMSFCPYGNQMEDILRPVFDLIGSKAEIRPHYIFEEIDNLSETCKLMAGDITKCPDYVANKYFATKEECEKVIKTNNKECNDPKNYIKSSDGVYYASLHGRVEANENIREICAYNLATDKKLWWDFISQVNKNCTSQNADSCWEEQAKKAGLDSAKITECFDKDGIKLIEEEIALTTKNQITASPTVLVNGINFPPEDAYTQDGKGSVVLGKVVIPQAEFRTPNTQKEALCAGFKKVPEECKTILKQDQKAAAAAATAGGCQ